MAFVTRFAPSPTGPVHLGHAYSAMLAADMARAAGGRFLLRIEDIDRARSRASWEAQIYDDLHWLGLDWPDPVMRQSKRLAVYGAALDALWARGLLYHCTCTRRDIETAMSAPQEGAMPFGPDGLIYPGTCRDLQRKDGVLRLNMATALDLVDDLNFTETGPRHAGRIEMDKADYLNGIGDIVLARRDMGTSYHLSVVLDDAELGTSHVVRGEDLFEATAIHVLLQRLFGLPTPEYHHHTLIRDAAGKRLAKRDDARALAKYRAEGRSPTDIRQMVGL
ncbi:tRNA glutamyl-Q(34) synthetase GluQRS (plasmid) [Pseudorhodobacter turbinis]|uniref:tRNA glutamyl-Q(34) synthetase GluQRS n=1 Tax=Pseudorhodobacter turbinis TaxID=2500533 RepID=A0A4P8EIT5_9RHOB|nr:tRNA glutamyl-Q(34) synthetase GluQRS [Pseudorhodobacter turbinis]QCO56896.1 tRNA glutamyl-Q(34) synthetase GluQRS [Pseudorhodobacter turbinis]